MKIPEFYLGKQGRPRTPVASIPERREVVSASSSIELAMLAEPTRNVLYFLDGGIDGGQLGAVSPAMDNLDTTLDGGAL